MQCRAYILLYQCTSNGILIIVVLSNLLHLHTLAYISTNKPKSLHEYLLPSVGPCEALLSVFCCHLGASLLLLLRFHLIYGPFKFLHNSRGVCHLIAQ